MKCWNSCPLSAGTKESGKQQERGIERRDLIWGCLLACVHRKWKNVLRGGLRLYNEAQMKTGRSCSREMDVESSGQSLYCDAGVQ